MLASAAKQPMLTIDDQEARDLSDALCEINEQYDSPINPRVAALLNLAGTAFAVYGPRLMFVMMMRKPAPARPAEERRPQDNIRPVVQGAPAAVANETAPIDFGGGRARPLDTPEDLRPTSGQMKFG